MFVIQKLAPPDVHLANEITINSVNVNNRVSKINQYVFLFSHKNKLFLQGREILVDA